VLLSLASTSVAVAPAWKLARRSRRGVRLRGGGGAGSRVAGLAAAGAGASGGQASLTATMASASTPAPAAPAAGAAGSGPVTSRTSASSSSSGGLHLRRHLAAAFKEPVVVAPVTALILVLAGVSLPSTVVQSLKLLGTTSTGAALFALGIVLYAQRITLSKSVLTLTAARNVLVPAVLWAALVALGASHMLVREAVVALALPAVLIVTILSVQYKQSEREMASAMFFSYVLAIVTVGAFITLTYSDLTHSPSNESKGISMTTASQPIHRPEQRDTTSTVRDVTFDLLRECGLTTVFGNVGSTEEAFLENFPSDFR
jgi:hypothetical protein